MSIRSTLILTYHSVLEPRTEEEREIVTTPQMFARHMQTLVSLGYTTLTAGQLRRRFESGEPLGARTAVITFDDGYLNFYENALPVLQQHGLTATVFVTSGYLGRAGDWETGGEYPSWMLMTPQQVAQAHAAGIEIGGHSVNHLDLTQAGSRLQSDVTGNRQQLEDIIGAPVTEFAYPFGRYNRRVMAALTEAGFRSGGTCTSGKVTASQDPLQWRRVDAGANCDLESFKTLLRWGGQPKALLRAAAWRSLQTVRARFAGLDPLDQMANAHLRRLGRPPDLEQTT